MEDGEIESSWLVTILGAGPTGGEKERKLWGAVPRLILGCAPLGGCRRGIVLPKSSPWKCGIADVKWGAAGNLHRQSSMFLVDYTTGTFKLGLLSGGRNWWLWRRTATRTVLYTGAGSTHLWSIYRLMGSGVLKISPPRVKRRSKSALCSVQQTGKSPRSSIRVPAFYSVLGSIWLNLQVSRWGRANIQWDTRLTSN